MNSPLRRYRHLGCPALLASTLLALGGCSSAPESHLVTAPPPSAPVVVAAAPAQQVVAAPGAGTTLVVTQAPPVAQQEVPPPRPSSNYVWVGGYWTWNSTYNRYEWTGGHWEIPPRDGAVWIPPRWEQEGNAYRFYNGYWD